MLIFDRENRKSHLAWAIFTIAATVAAAGWYTVASLARGRFLGGGSLPGITFGLIGGGICLFEFLIWPRKKMRRWRIGRVQTWMKAHIWLGLLSLPILLLHSGPNLGGALSMSTMTIFLVVIASGVWGLWLQNRLPGKMLAEVQAETIYSQIDRVIGQFRDEASRLVQAICGKAAMAAALAAEADDEEESSHHIVVGAVRSAGKISGKVLQTRTILQAVAGSEPLRVFFDTVVGPFLTPKGFATSPLRRADRSSAMFADLKTKLDPLTHPVVDSIQGLCDQRRQLAEQERLHFWLHGWLIVHLPLSVGLMVLMFVHAFVALKYL